ncbi:MAG: deoxynucleoside kinase [bacterium]|nr:deoxynucleoside kinase [bacterium]
MNYGFYSIEGLPGLGKSTVLKKLDKSFVMMKEIPEEAKKVKRKRKFKNRLEKIRYDNEWYLARELERIKRAKGTKKNVTIFDRCIYSQIAHNFANDKMHGTEELFRLFSRLIELENNGLALTMKIIYLKATPDFSIKRRLQRGRGDEVRKVKTKAEGWHTTDFLEYAKQAYEKIVAVLHNNAITISVPRQQKNMDFLINKYVNKTRDKKFDVSITKIRELFL